MVLLFTHQNSQRIHYIFSEVLTVRFGFTMEITTDWEYFQEKPNTFKVLYTENQLDTTSSNHNLWVYNSGLLHENFLRPGDFKPTAKAFKFNFVSEKNTFTPPQFQQIEALFLSPDFENGRISNDNGEIINEHSIHFDLFAEIFWCISRYEEVQWQIENGGIASIEKQHNKPTRKPATSDKHGRYPAHESLLYEMRWLQEPVVDKLVWLFGYFMNKQPVDVFEIIPTADIDMALRYGGRSLFTQVGSFLRDCFFKPSLLIERFSALFLGKDPYQIDKETIPFLQQFAQYKLFFLFHNQRDSRNKQIELSALNDEIKRCLDGENSNHTNIHENWGIHPSWQEKNNAMKTQTAWRTEVESFNQAVGYAPKHSRFHYIHLHMPYSYNILQNLGITHDWSMGYPDEVGFRAGTSKPYIWYDLISESISHITVHPFCIMDVTCKNYLSLNHDTSIQYANSLKQKLQSVSGTFCFVFHNESVSESYPWVGWKNTIEHWGKAI